MMPTVEEGAAVPYLPPAHGFRTFVVLWASQSFSLIGSALTLFAANIWLAQTLYARPEQRAALAFALAATTLAYALPAVFGAPLAGAWVDRHDRRRTMLVAGVANGVLCLILAATLATGTLQLWLLLTLLACYSAAESLHYAAFDTSYAMLVPERLLPRANGMMQTMQNFSFLFAPALAATLIALPALARQGTIPGGIGAAIGRFADGTAFAIALDGLTFFATAAVLLFLVIPSPLPAATSGRATPGLWADVRVGFVYIWRRRPLLWLLGTFAVANLTGTPVIILLPLLVKFTLAADWTARGFGYESALATLSTALGVGGVAGGIIVSAWGGLRSRRVYGVVVPMLLGGLATVALGLSPLLPLSVAMLFIFSFANPVLNAHSQTIWQTQTPRAMQGRVFAVRRLIAQCTLPLASVIAGTFGGAFGAGAVIVGCGAVIALFCLAQLFNPALLRVEDKAWLDELATRAAASNGQERS